MSLSHDDMHDRPALLHVSADFPDPVQPFKTPVIRELVDLTAEHFDHEVISLNRVSPGWIELARMLGGRGGGSSSMAQAIAFDYGRAVNYRAPARGVLHHTMLRKLAEEVAAGLGAGLGPRTLLVGHKLTVEGLVVHHLARLLGVPYALSLQGDTDSKILAARPDLRRTFARVYHGASMVFSFAPWIRRHLDRCLGERSGPGIDLPCPTELDTPLAPVVGGNGLVSVFHLKNAKRKNLNGMARAMQILADSAKGPSPRLTVIGGGSPDDQATCATIARNAAVDFEGPVARADMAARMNAATGLVLPSLRESFGLVFIEALFAGIPVIYPAGQAVTGYFDDAPFALAVDPRDPAAIAAAMQCLVSQEAELKAALSRWQASQDAERFRRPAIRSSFTRGLVLALENPHSPAISMKGRPRP